MQLKGVRNAVTVFCSVVLLEGHLPAACEVVVILGCITRVTEKLLCKDNFLYPGGISNYYSHRLMLDLRCYSQYAKRIIARQLNFTSCGNYCFSLDL